MVLAAEALTGWFVLWTIHEGKGIEQKKAGVEEEEQ